MYNGGSPYYQGTFRVVIDGKDTFHDWHLLSTARPFVSPPIPKTRYVDILGMSGSLDYTEAPNKLPKYSDREGSWEFVMLNPSDLPDYTIEDVGTYTYPWYERYSEILGYLQGKKFTNIVVADDFTHYYRGRVWVNEYRSDPGWGRIVLNYHLEPFKYSVTTPTIHSVEYTGREIHYNQNSNSNLVEQFHIQLGLMPTPLHIKATTSDTDASHTTHGCRVAYYNRELEVRKRWTFHKSTGSSSDIIAYDVLNGIQTTYLDFDREYVLPECSVSNIAGNDCILSIGCFDNNETMYGPLKIEFWWEEAVL